MIQLVPDWVYWIAIGVLAAAVGAQQVRVLNVKTDLAQEQKARSEETTLRTQAALYHTTAIGLLQSQHASDQQLSEEHYAKLNKTLDDERRADAAVAGRLRDKLAAYTTPGSQPGDTDTTAGQRAADRLEALGSVVREGVDLVTEARSIIGRRDAEVGRLLNQVRIDRAACSPD